MIIPWFFATFLDIDECSITKEVCGPGQCQNVPGTFTCDCQEGYESMPMMPQCMGKIVQKKASNFMYNCE